MTAGFNWSFGGLGTSGASFSASVLTQGATFGERYAIDGLLGEGSTGRVFSAIDQQTGQPVAIKVLRNALEEARRERFAREGELTARLRHPGIVAVLGGGVTLEGKPFLVLERVEGARTLAQAVAADPRALLPCLVEVARAVGHAHGQGVVHRDLKPANVLVDRTGRPRVCDFGLGWRAGLTSLTQSGSLVGTPLYMAPERFGAQAESGPPADVWSLGVILYEALSGRVPFDGGGTLPGLQAQIASADPVPPRQLAPGVPLPLEAVCLRALAKDPRARFGDGEAFADALEQAGASASRPGHVVQAQTVGGEPVTYELREKLGAGGMGVVYRAYDPELGREVALKLLQGEVTEARRVRFQREGRAVAALTHPGIVQVHSTGWIDGSPYLAFDMIGGARPLDEAWRTLAKPARLDLLAQLVDAVAHAHAAGVVHRDLKPDNVLVDARGQVHLADFGLAWTDGSERLTQTGAMLGSPHTMAPEQVSRTAGEFGPQTDVWALGVLLYLALTDVLPFAGEAGLLELLAQITSAQFVPPRQLNPEVSPALEAVCARALRVDPSARYADGAAFGAALAEAREARVSRGPLLWVGVALVLLLIVLGAWTLSQPEAAPPPPPPPPATDPPPQRPPPSKPTRPRPAGDLLRSLELTTTSLIDRKKLPRHVEILTVCENAVWLVTQRSLLRFQRRGAELDRPELLTLPHRPRGLSMLGPDRGLLLLQKDGEASLWVLDAKTFTPLLDLSNPVNDKFAHLSTWVGADGRLRALLAGRVTSLVTFEGAEPTKTPQVVELRRLVQAPKSEFDAMRLSASAVSPDGAYCGIVGMEEGVTFVEVYDTRTHERVVVQNFMGTPDVIAVPNRHKVLVGNRMGAVFVFEGTIFSSLIDTTISEDRRRFVPRGIGLAHIRSPKKLILLDRTLISVAFSNSEPDVSIKLWDRDSGHVRARLQIKKPYSDAVWDPHADGLWIVGKRVLRFFKAVR